MTDKELDELERLLGTPGSTAAIRLAEMLDGYQLVGELVAEVRRLQKEVSDLREWDLDRDG